MSSESSQRALSETRIRIQVETAIAALETAAEIDAENNVLGPGEREDMTVPMGRLQSLIDSLPAKQSRSDQ